MEALQHAVAVYGYVALLPLAVIEGPAVTVFAAFLAAQGLLDVGVVYAVVVLGDLLGDVLYYVAGRFLLQRLVTWHRAWATRLRHRVGVLAQRVRARAGAMLLFGKLTHSAGFAVLLAAGAAHVPIRRFLAYNLLGTLPKSLLFVVIGYWFGRLYLAVQGDLRIAGVIGFVLASGVLALAAKRLLTLDERGA
ncbi:MAG TPA: VTT domain-containing protein [Acetobacteraceae bacterium]|jgi:membrane protein DedA with SNARE-associated domain|nr:VTT domain-containing protein [Acetobacteraceae bacterium]